MEESETTLPVLHPAADEEVPGCIVAPPALRDATDPFPPPSQRRKTVKKSLSFRDMGSICSNDSIANLAGRLSEHNNDVISIQHSSEAAAETGALSDSFHELLRQVGEVHERSLEVLRQENSRLQMLVKAQDSADAGRSHVSPEILPVLRISHVDCAGPEDKSAPPKNRRESGDTNAGGTVEKTSSFKALVPSFSLTSKKDIVRNASWRAGGNKRGGEGGGGSKRGSGASRASRASEQSFVSMRSAKTDSSKASTRSHRSGDSKTVKAKLKIGARSLFGAVSASQRSSLDDSTKGSLPSSRQLSFDDAHADKGDEDDDPHEVPLPTCLIKKPKRRTSDTAARDLLPSKFVVLAGWQDNAVKMRGFSTKRNSRMDEQEMGDIAERDISHRRSLAKSLFWHPSSQKRLYWDLSGLVLLGHDLIMIPFVSAFEPGETAFLSMIIYIGIAFWTVDMFLSFITGYQEKHGVIVMDPWRVAKRYLKSWFVLDVFLVTFDWLLMTIWAEEENDINNNSASKLGRSLRTVRFLRSVRLLRLLKLKRIFQEIQDNIDNEVMSTYWGILKITVMIATANHVIACLWYSIGVSGDDGTHDSPNWVRKNGLFERDIKYRYTTSMHWSLTQFMPASMEVYPNNLAERVFTIVVAYLAMITFSSFISTLTSSMTQLRNRTANETRQFWLLRRYLKDLCITKKTSLRVQRYLECAWRRNQNCVQEKEVHLLGLLSQPLAEEVKHESFAPHLETHALFKSVGALSKTFTGALQAVSFAARDVCFKCGLKSESMLIVADGEFEYCKQSDEEADLGQDASFGGTASPQDDDIDSELGSCLTTGEWICEASLWTSWVHLGDLQAVTDASVISIDTAIFGQGVSRDLSLWYVLHKYGQRFVEELNVVNREFLCDLAQRHFSPVSVLPGRGGHSEFRGSQLSEDLSGNITAAATSFWNVITRQK